jgi:hypothetical protein
METTDKSHAPDLCAPSVLTIGEVDDLPYPLVAQPFYAEAIRVRITREGLFNRRGNQPAFCTTIRGCTDWLLQAVPTIEMIEAALCDTGRLDDFEAVKPMVWLPKKTPRTEEMVERRIRCYIHDARFSDNTLTFAERYRILADPQVGVLRALTPAHPLEFARTFTVSAASEVAVALYHHEKTGAAGILTRGLHLAYPEIHGASLVHGRHTVQRKVVGITPREGDWHGAVFLDLEDDAGRRSRAPFKAALGLARSLGHVASSFVGSTVSVEVGYHRGPDGELMNQRVIPPCTE